MIDPYKTCLELAGANVLAFETFGSYQGDWLAFVVHNGQKGIVKGSYGSCTVCDAFQSEFNYGEPYIFNGKYYNRENTSGKDCSKEEYEKAITAYNQKLIDFGKSYLTAPLYQKEYFERKLETLDPKDRMDNEEAEWVKWAINQNW